MLFGTLTRGPESASELITPALCAQLDRLDVVSKKLFAGKLQGERRSKKRGRSVEFDDYRAYVAGDDLRHIDWNVFARMDRFFIKVFQEDEDLAVHLVLDASASMNAGEPCKLLTAARLAMALGYVGLVNNNRVLCSVIGAGAIRRLEPLRGRMSTQRLAQFLLREAFAGVSMSGPSATGGPDFTASLRTISSSPGGKGVLVLISDLLVPGSRNAYQDGLRLLAGAAAGGAMDVEVLQMLSPGELDPASESAGQVVMGDLRLSDAETGRASEVTITPELLAGYRASVAKFIESAADFCAARGMGHTLVRSDADIAGLLMGDLRRRGVLK
jgi:hypothetical protein